MNLLRKYDVQIPPRIIKELKRISDLSGKKRWEYAGKIELKNKTFKDPLFVTSRDRGKVKLDTVKKLWPSQLCFHTHPSVTRPCSQPNAYTVFCTLPSKHDFDSFIYNFPQMQVNIICDAHGYYVISVLASAERGNCAVPAAVEQAMNNFRHREDLRDMVFSEEGLEYFEARLETWKELINHELNTELTRLFGISIRYYAYDDEAPVITLLQN
jgi:hypothetical protein